MKKLLITCAAIMTACVAFAAGSMAATYPATYDAEALTVGSTALDTAVSTIEGQLTVVVAPADETGVALKQDLTDAEIYYINQDEYSELTLTALLVKGELPDGDYVIAVGGENIQDGIKIATLTVSANTVEILWGDINLDNGVDIDDMTAVIQSMLGTNKEFGDYKVNTEFTKGMKWGDINLNGDVDIDDMTAIIQSMLGTNNVYGDYKVNQKATITITK